MFDQHELYQGVHVLNVEIDIYLKNRDYTIIGF